MFEAIFSSFWTWAGAVILVAVVLGGVTDIIKAAKKPKRAVRMTTYRDKTCILEINGAEEDDVEQAMKVAKSVQEPTVLEKRYGHEVK